MPKPRVFIGSSVEALDIADAIHANLSHVAEVTVWDQGIFELSRTTIESLTSASESADFAVFVFRADDMVRMRDKDSASVRDNVIFEFGLFIGRLGRGRVFFVIPQKSELTLPSDLLGITPGTYDVDRSDGNMEAATSPACNKIKIQMRKLGYQSNRDEAEAGADAAEGAAIDPGEWVLDLIEKRFDAAKAALTRNLATEAGEDAVATMAYIAYAEAWQLEGNCIAGLLKFVAAHEESPRAAQTSSNLLKFDGHVSTAVRVMSDARERFPDNAEVIKGLAACLSEDLEVERAIEELTRPEFSDHPDVAVDLADILDGAGRAAEALAVILKAYNADDVHRGVRFKLARLSLDTGEAAVAAFILNGLIKEDSSSSDYWGYMGNSCLQLNLHDTAMAAYRKALELVGSGRSSSWITSNIGNLLSTRGLFSDAKHYLEQALVASPESEYAHDRLATALKKRSVEDAEVKRIYGEGRTKLRQQLAIARDPPAHQ